MNTGTGSDSDGHQQLEEYDLSSDDYTKSGRRPPWTRIWRSTEPYTLAVYRTSLLSRANLYRCCHSMRSQLVQCRSRCCKASKRR
ncbi:hypothetical protein JG687_00018674 [Phytophthora cactorum]|uniref:Uncharacterized protein n=1 Tax=Phytophthora cactorum TaxID=29920 RepID=A0A8T1TK79_9STRA|nr:hypothetical protein JG687_00018674 [Phytophthora cactorum]